MNEKVLVQHADMRGFSTHYLRIKEATVSDRGEYECRAGDFGQNISRSVFLDVVPPPILNVMPLNPTVQPVKLTSNLIVIITTYEPSNPWKWQARFTDGRRIYSIRQRSVNFLTRLKEFLTSWNENVNVKFILQTNTTARLIGQSWQLNTIKISAFYDSFEIPYLNGCLRRCTMNEP